MADPQITPEQIRRVRRDARLLWIVSFVTLMIGIGGFGTASNGEVEMFGITMEAKYACFIYFVLGAVCLWATLGARKRGLDA